MTAKQQKTAPSAKKTPDLKPAAMGKHDKLAIPADWTFQSSNVAENFDLHVREQLPWYELATGIVAHLGRHYLPKDGLMYDVGASTGNITKALEREIMSRVVRAISIDNSPQMKQHFKGVGEFQVADVTEYTFDKFDFASVFLVLMFLTPERQRELVDELVSNLKPGGAIVIFDRTATFNGYLSQVVNRLTLAGKVATGVPAESIVRKELSLGGIQRPIDPDFIGLTGEGFQEIFRFGDFAGWVLTK